MKYTKLSKCIIASSLLTSIAIGAAVPILTTKSTQNNNDIINQNQTIQTGKIIHDANVQVVNNVNEIKIESVTSLTQSAYTYANTAIVNNNGIQEVYVWGYNVYGQLGNGNVNNVLSPIKFDIFQFGKYNTIELHIADTESFSSYALVDYGRGKEIFVWGRNDNGELGLGNTTNQTTPLPISKTALGNYDNIQAVQLGFQSLYITTIKNGQQQLFVSGRNSEGQLGIGNTTNQSTFQLITNNRLGNYIKIEKIVHNGNTVSALITTMNGLELYVWGENTNNQLGIGNATNVVSPTRHTSSIFNSFNLATTEYNFGRYSSYALNRLTNQLYTWGYNAFGQLGLGGTDTSNRPNPVLVSSSSLGNGIIQEIQISTYSSYAKVLINNSEQRIYTWGRNTEGQLGNNNTTNQTAPGLFDMSRIGNPTIINKLFFPHYDLLTTQTSYALVTINNKLELYVWGQNNYGQLNNGTTTNASTPQKMSLPSNMTLVNASVTFSLWLHLTDQNGKNKYFTTGRNTEGQLGIGNNTNQTVLTEVLPIVNTNFINKNMPSTLSSTDALNLFKNDTSPNYTVLKNFIEFIDVPANSLVTIDNTSSADFNSGLMELVINSSLTYPLLNKVAQTTNTKYVLRLKFMPVNDIDQTPIAAFSNVPTGAGDAQNFYKLIVDANNNVINRPLLAKYVNLSSVPQDATLSITKRDVTNDTYKLDFTIHTNMVYKNGGIQTFEQVSSDIVIALPFINYGLILGLTIPFGILLILAIIFGYIYYKRQKNSHSIYLRT